jgi:hypothetical protein
MDLSNIITSTNYTIQEGITAPVMNKITEVTGMQWKLFSPNTDILSTLYPAINNFFSSWQGLLIGIIMLILLGEILFYSRIKKDKAKYTETNDNFILKTKVLSYICSFILLTFTISILPTLFCILSVFILNLHIFLALFIPTLIVAISLGVVTCLALKVIVKINKKLFGHLIKQETKEEYELRQAQYKFRDGTIVKVKPNIVAGMIIDNREATRGIEVRSNAGTIYIIQKHRNNGKVELETSKEDNNFPGRRECWIEEASEEEKIKFKQEQEEYNKKQEVKKQGKLYKLCSWLISIK